MVHQHQQQPPGKEGGGERRLAVENCTSGAPLVYDWAGWCIMMTPPVGNFPRADADGFCGKHFILKGKLIQFMEEIPSKTEGNCQEFSFWVLPMETRAGS